MEKLKYMIIAGILLVAVITGFIIYSDSEAAKIKKQFKSLAQKIKKTPGGSPGAIRNCLFFSNSIIIC